MDPRKPGSPSSALLFILVKSLLARRTAITV